MNARSFLFLSLILLSSLIGSAQEKKQPLAPFVELPANTALPYESFEGDVLQSRRYTLSNGLTVYLSRQPKEPRIQSMVVIRTGSRNDPADNTGLAHYLEHLLFKGTTEYGTLNYAAEKPLLAEITRLYELHKASNDTAERRKIYHQIDSISYIASQFAIANEYDKMMQAMGVNGVNAYTSNDETVYINDIPTNQINKWLEIEADRFRNPVIRLFHTELEAVYEEKNRSLDSDDSKSYEKLLYGLFPTHPYGLQSTIGTSEHLKSPSIIAIEDYFNKHYVPRNMALILSGDFDPDSLIVEIEKTFGTWQQKPMPVNTIYPFNRNRAYQTAEVVGPNPEYVMFGFETPGGKLYENAYVEIINSLLYNGKAGLMDINLNLPQKVQSAYSFSYSMNDASAHIFVGVPRENQSLPEVQALLLAEIDKIKKGDFKPELLQAIIDNKELEMLRSYQSNYSRCGALADAFIRGYSWKSYQTIVNAYKTVTKEDIVSFANYWYKDDYVTIFKREGIDTSLEKMSKPQIRPIELNADKQSDYVKAYAAREVPSIKPQFVDFDRDLQRTKTASGMELFYVQNEENQLFSLYYILEMGSLNDLNTAFAIELLPYLGTDLYSPEEINNRFFELAADFGVSSGSERIYVYLSGLQKNFDASLELFEHLIRNAKPNQEALDALVARTLKGRENTKKNKRAILQGALRSYTIYGKDNPFTYRLNKKQLQALKAEELTPLIKQLFDYEHSAFYFGPKSLLEMAGLIHSMHPIPAIKKPIPPAKTFVFREAPKKNQVFFVDYDMVQAEVLWIRNVGLYDENLVPLASLFNGYFDGGMGTVVFQELRESQALAYSTYARFGLAGKPSHPNMVNAYIGTQSDKFNDAVPAMVKLFNTEPTNELAIEKARTALKQSLETRRVLEQDLYFFYLSSQYMGRNYDINKRIYEEIDHIGLPQVQAFQSAYFSYKPFYYCVLASKKKVSMKDLKRIGKVKVLTLDEIFGEE